MTSSTVDVSSSLVRVLRDGETFALSALTDFVGSGETGAIVTFEGRVRESENAQQIEALHYEHHPDMAQNELDRVVNAALQRFDVQRIACVHRVGRVPVGQASVAIAVGSAHRAAAFDACEFVINELKAKVPIWKKPL